MITARHTPGAGNGVDRFGRSHAVHVWHGRVPDVPDPDDVALLDAAELRTYQGRSAPFDGHYAGAHAAVRRILADQYLGCPPSAIRFGRHACPRCADATHGRPRVVAPATRLDFSLSRSGAYWLLAVTAGGQVGIDLEVHGGLDLAGMAEVALSAGELAALDTLGSEPEREAFFLRSWTRKEAILKAAGIGIVAELRSLDVSPQRDGQVSVACTDPAVRGVWRVEDLPLGPGLSAAVARRHGDPGPVLLRSSTAALAA
ncbi:4'-phosphopantetheinyl transferase superfamily protein [Streptomyces sp. VRA16 Mangrove soil]|uniref:4'-phosphopantetheinyl transferase family protein n=1 Tax=Streptomyces sp. VRA16 Mangrove soil TaxID=2817434 RepID=UPI001A9D3D9D|nr:4'-phosphopantetheinyl transferase superfamily protein [Streptomyces sp. VRA16 Mangrove soil]MBO1334098.1 4'-phosphopantetheinyl transferase superfamily protein [Streptomyces sp. VRA16 Mangrove soil]